MKRLTEGLAALGGAALSFFYELPPVLWVLIGVMTLDYVTGLMTGWYGKSDKTRGGGLSSRAALAGLLRKGAVLLIVLLAALTDRAVSMTAGVPFEAAAGAVCLWFIASEGLSVIENAAALGVPIPGKLRQALEKLRESGEKE